jgi:Zinc-binding dehydrogenase
VVSGEIGFDAAINYKKATDLTAAVKESCPKGVDVFFDNTGGPIHDAVMRNVAIGARVIICGRIAAQFGKPDVGERFMGQLIVSRASIQGFLVLDWWHRRDEALKRLSEWQAAGKIHFKEDVLDGIERLGRSHLEDGCVHPCVAKGDPPWRRRPKTVGYNSRVALVRAVKSSGSVPVAHRFSGATESATVAKPSTNFTDSLPSLFELLSGLWLKTVAGPQSENQKTVRRQTDKYPMRSLSLLRAQGCRKTVVRCRVCSVGSSMAAGRSDPHALSYFVVHDSSRSFGDQNPLRRGSDRAFRGSATNRVRSILTLEN